MRILIQNCKTLLFFREDGLWTSIAEEAKEFKSSLEALEFCRLANAEDVQIVMRFSREDYDVQLPVSEGC